MKKIILALLVSVFAFYSNTFALSCAGPDYKSLIKEGGYVLVGTVKQSTFLSEENTSYGGTRKYSVTVDAEYIWGNQNKSVTFINTVPKFTWTGGPNDESQAWRVPQYKVGEKYFLVVGYYKGEYVSGLGDCSLSSKISNNENLEIYISRLNKEVGPATVFANIPTPLPPVYNDKNYCAYTNINSNLWYGNTNNNKTEIYTLQNFLFRYYDVLDEISPSGFFGKLTKSYVTQFQKEQKINPTGGVGIITRQKMRDICGTINRSDSMPVVKSFTGPVKLNLNEKGTWKINANISDNTPLSYNITWGDETSGSGLKSSYAPATYDSLVTQNTSFEHTYSSPGTYTVTITVSAQNGQNTKTTSTVSVSSGMYCYNAGTPYSEGKKLGCLTNSDGSKSCIMDADYICSGGTWKIEGGVWGTR